MAFHVGQKVVCVDVSAPLAGKTIRGSLVNANLNGLTLGATYTVRGFGISWTDGSAGIYLDEIVRIAHEGAEITFAARRFRPVIERKTDISIFTAMLTPNRVNA